MKVNNVVLALVTGLVLAACASVPAPVSRVTADRFPEIPPRALVYALVDTETAAPIVEQTLAGTSLAARLAPVLERTERLAVAWYPAGEKQRVFAVASGAYPTFRSWLSLSLDRDWKRRTTSGGQAYWISRSTGYALSLSSRLVRLSDGLPFVAAAGPTIPDSFSALAADAAIAGWTETGADLAAVLLGLPEQVVRLPADQLFFAVYPQGTRAYRVQLRLETGSERQNRALLTLLTLADKLLGRSETAKASAGQALLRSLMDQGPRLDGTALILESGSLSAADIALLLPVHLVY